MTILRELGGGMPFIKTDAKGYEEKESDHKGTGEVKKGVDK